MTLSLKMLKNWSIGFAKSTGLTCAVLAACLVHSSATHADVIEVDRSALPPELAEVFAKAEATWEARIQNYSTELPRAVLVQLTKLRILAVAEPIDGELGTLAQAGPDALVSFESGSLFRPVTRVVPVVSTMTLDTDDIAFMQANGILEDVITHEMGHALGFGTLFEPNNLTGALGGVGLTQYIGGTYAIKGYRRDLGIPVLRFVPLEQGGGAGTALGHWSALGPFFDQAFTPAFKKELMTGAINSINPVTGQSVIAPSFISNATWGAMADLGYEVSGVNDNSQDPPTSQGTGRWPKVTGQGFDPFAANGVEAAAGTSFTLVKIRATSKWKGDGNSKPRPDGVGSTNATDPYNLRNGRWIK